MPRRATVLTLVALLAAATACSSEEPPEATATEEQQTSTPTAVQAPPPAPEPAPTTTEPAYPSPTFDLDDPITHLDSLNLIDAENRWNEIVAEEGEIGACLLWEDNPDFVVRYIESNAGIEMNPGVAAAWVNRECGTG